MANKNPEQFADIDKVISQILNPKETQAQRNERIRKEIAKELNF